jgi:two-component system OmpR family sensor kinase
VSERLTRQELSWLLTQEARGAAERLRKGVQILTKPPPPPPASKSDRAPASERPVTLTSTGEESEGLESTLDMLDGAMSRLAQIYGPAAQRPRKGRVDLAALLWEVAPDAKVQLEPGAGTEVFADESELRRMLHVLLGAMTQAGVGGAQVVGLRRDGDDVRLSVALGPDTAPISPAERGWLARMAIRYGGRYELDGASECLIFPALEAEQRAEVQTLRKELEAAKAQGEAYARELAAVFAEPTLSSRPPSYAESMQLGTPPVAVAPLARIADALADDLRAILSPLGAAKLKGDPATLAHNIDGSLARGAELLSLARLMARIGGDIEAIPVDLAQIARDETMLATVAFSSRGVVLTNSIEEGSLELIGKPAALRAMFSEMLDRALRSAVPGGEVRVATEGRTLRVEVVEGASEVAAAPAEVRSARPAGRAAVAFLGEIARAHRMTLQVTDRGLSVVVPP